MAIDNSDIIDFIGVSKTTNEVMLTIADHFDWSSTDDHLTTLQLKINRYISFIESGEIYERCKEAFNKPIIIEVVGKFPLPPEAILFYDRANIILQSIDSKLRFKHFQS
jgi:hypothetical protein